MSQSVMNSLNIGCPHCGSASNVDIAHGGRDDSGPGDRLKGKLVHCPYCGDDFSFYYY